jgi:LmbE family N-acetylglucosaminyl deacetylase
MSENLRLMCVLAHPDDETLGNGSTLAKYAAEGVEVHLVTATRGERGWYGEEKDYPGIENLGKIRENELRCAAKTLGIRQVYFLDYIDGELDQASHMEAVGKIARHIWEVKPHVVLTFGPEGAYGHPDHIAISQFTQAALICAADPNYDGHNGHAPHRVQKFYYMTISPRLYDAYISLIGDISMNIDGIERKAAYWDDWAITTRIDGEEHWRTAWDAIYCHQSQLPSLGNLDHLTVEQRRYLMGECTYYRAFSLVNSGRSVETDLFSGLR